MSTQSTGESQLQAVVGFAHMTEKAAEAIGCSYADAAAFLMRLSELGKIMGDADFRAKLDAYVRATAQQNTNTPIQGGQVH